MSALLQGFPDAILRTTLALACTAIVVRLLLFVVRPKSPLAHRFAWACVLMQGALLAQWSIEIPWYDPEPIASLAIDDAALNDLPEPAAEPDRRHESEAWMATAGPFEPTSRGGRSPLMLIWLTGIVLVFGLTAASYSLLLHSLRRATRARTAWQQEWQDLLDGQGIRASIPLLVHPTLGPMLCWRPRGYCVVVPSELWQSFTPAQRLAILRHELAHYQRGDVWKSLIARLLILPHWFNPLAWWSVRKFEEGGEWACDQQLADSDPRHVPAFARALLAIVEPDANRAFASAARGASVSVRLRRLLSFQTPEDSLMKRCLVFAALIALLALGICRLQLVTRAVAQDDEQEERAVAAAYDRGAAELAENLAADTDLVREFRDALRTPAGKIVLQDRASFFAERMREEAQTDALPAYFEKNFDKLPSDDGGYKYVLREDREEYKEEFITTADGFNEDVEQIGIVLREMAEQVTGDSEIERLLARFMKSDAAPVMLYVNELRERLRPDAGVIERRLGEIFVANEEGKFIVRPGRKEQAADFLRKAQRVHRALGTIHEELKAMSEEFAERDELNKRVKKHLAEPMFAAFIAASVMEDDGDVGRRIEGFFEEFNHIAVDTADGLAIIEDEPREEVTRALGEYQRLATAAPKLAGPLKSFAARIDAAGDLEKGWQKLLSSDVAALKFAEEFEPSSAEPGEIVRDLLGEVFDEGDNGELVVRDDNQEEITEFVRDQFRTYRTLRRHGRTIERAAESIADEELSEVFTTLGGKYVVIYSVRREFANREYNGLTMWVNEVFEATDEGLVLREDTEDEIEGFLADVREVTEELKRDDF